MNVDKLIQWSRFHSPKLIRLVAKLIEKIYCFLQGHHHYHESGRIDHPKYDSNRICIHCGAFQYFCNDTLVWISEDKNYLEQVKTLLKKRKSNG